MIFIETDFSGIIRLLPDAYVGGSNVTDIEDFKKYVRNKPSLGTARTSELPYCCFYATDNVRQAESLFLQMGPAHNEQRESNCQAAPGFVYVCSKAPPPTSYV